MEFDIKSGIAGLDDDLNNRDKTGVPPIHIRVQQRKSNKYITIVEGIASEFDLKKILRAFKKQLNCNGTIAEGKEGDKVLQLTGDQRQACAEFFISEGIAEKEHIKVHGA